MTTIRKEQFVNQMKLKALSIDSLPQALQSEVQRQGVDLNGDGVIAGDREMNKYFQVLDSFDRDGHRATLQTQKKGKLTASGRYYQLSRKQAHFDDSLGCRTQARKHMEQLKKLPTQAAQISYLSKAYHVSREVAEQVIRWTQLRPHPGNPNNPGQFIQALNDACAGKLSLKPRVLVGSITQSEQYIQITLKNGTKLSLKKYETLFLDLTKKKYFTTTLVDAQGKAKLSGGLTPETDRKISAFLKNVDAAIKKQQALVSRLSGAEQSLAKTKLKELLQLRTFGVRVFLNIEAGKRNIKTCPDTDAVLRDYRFGHPHADLTKVRNMLELMEDGRRYVIFNVVGSRAAYRGMGNVGED